MRRKSGLYAGDAGDGRSDPPIDVAMEMLPATTSMAAETAGATIFESMGRNEKGIQARTTEAAAAPSDWRSHTDRTISQQAEELTQLHQTVGHLANLADPQAAREEAQWLGLMTWM